MFADVSGGVYATAMTEPSKELELARSVLTDEARALDHAATLIDERFCEAVELIARCAQKDGTVLVSGLGKSGLIGAKISATLASLGVPSHPVHPTEATHGAMCWRITAAIARGRSSASRSSSRARSASSVKNRTISSSTPSN